MSYEPVLQVIRGDVVESVHHGAIVVSDPAGRTLAAWGDPGRVTFLRSTAKPFQALPLVESGALDALGLTDRQLALICASHAGTDEHAAVAASIQAQVGVQESDLQCGFHEPYDRVTAARLREAGLSPTPNRHNCSGKHSGMLALAKFLGAPTDTYLERDHPVQQRILSAFSAMAGLGPADVRIGTDGCSAPNFAVPLHAAAMALARLADPEGLEVDRASACKRIFGAMTRFPGMVSGEGRVDTVLMHAFNGRLLAKGGAEGYQGLALQAGLSTRFGSALGVAFKIADGDLAHRAKPAVLIEVLRQIGVPGVDAVADAPAFGSMIQRNFRGLKVGRLATCFELSPA